MKEIMQRSASDRQSLSSSHENDQQAAAARPDTLGPHDSETTLRMLARLEPPRGLEDRIHSRIREAEAEKELSTGRHRFQSFWGQWMPARRLQFAGAAILAIAVATSIWEIHHLRPVAGTVMPPAAHSVPFGSAKTERRPTTLAPIKVPPIPKKKPSASKVRTDSKVAAEQMSGPTAGMSRPSPN